MSLMSSLLLIPIVVTVWNRGNEDRERIRLPPIPADKMTEEQRKAAEEFRATRGTDIFGPFVPLLRSPDLMIRSSAMGDYLRYRSALPPRQSEFVILITARYWAQPYEWAVHQPIALEVGIDPDVVQAIGEGRRPESMSEDHAVLYDFCNELLHNREVSDQTYTRAVAMLGERGIIDTVGIVGHYSTQGMFLTVAHLPPDSGSPALPPCVNPNSW